ncbi:MAG: cation diffusion facilitator family transporter [Proteobacteria bacterium]|nr:cation diffusion facilitator family transporter [Pseudomonadota bacterium]MBI3497258.1 cation diffusion facilitator family transporter [Pseudomonadota bacterium]
MAEALATVPGSAAAGRLVRLASYASLFAALTFIAVKFAAWLATGSVAVLSSLVDSLLDVLGSLITYFAVRHALVPADPEHRFGHGKAEPLAALALGAFIAGSAVLIVLESVLRFLDPRPVQNELVGIAVMVFTILGTLALVGFQGYVVRRTRSMAIRADSLHYSGDLMLNGGVLVSLALSRWLGWNSIDPVFAVTIALYMLWNARAVGIDAFHMLMDRELPDADRERIKAIVLGHPDVSALHELRSRSSGPNSFIQLHVEMDGAITLERAHVIADEVEAAILAAFPLAEVIIHQDPAGSNEPHRRVL